MSLGLWKELSSPASQPMGLLFNRSFMPHLLIMNTHKDSVLAFYKL